jgi:ABC-type molybdate transport system substrate-binding protein
VGFNSLKSLNLTNVYPNNKKKKKKKNNNKVKSKPLELRSRVKTLNSDLGFVALYTEFSTSIDPPPKKCVVLIYDGPCAAKINATTKHIVGHSSIEANFRSSMQERRLPVLPRSRQCVQ